MEFGALYVCICLPEKKIRKTKEKYRHGHCWALAISLVSQWGLRREATFTQRSEQSVWMKTGGLSSFSSAILVIQGSWECYFCFCLCMFVFDVNIKTLNKHSLTNFLGCMLQWMPGDFISIATTNWAFILCQDIYIHFFNAPKITL